MTIITIAPAKHVKQVNENNSCCEAIFVNIPEEEYIKKLVITKIAFFISPH